MILQKRGEVALPPDSNLLSRNGRNLATTAIGRLSVCEALEERPIDMKGKLSLWLETKFSFLLTRLCRCAIIMKCQH